MAIMYPKEPKEFEPNSQEDLMFNALSKLPDEYYVFHSFTIVNVNNNTIYENEIDFVIFHPKKGILCIEAKAGNVKYEEGYWKYGNGIVMSHLGPFNQAETNKWKISKYFEKKQCKYLLDKCKLLHAVWFPSVDENHLKKVQLPAEADINLILTKESIEKAEQDISKIFDIKLPNSVQTDLDRNEEKIIIDKILAPTLDLISISEMKLESNKQQFARMLKEQVALLNYLEEQPDAVINGMAGTGKTVLAIEKAKRHADNNEKVLFLCYNSKLRDYLRNTFEYENIKYFNIDEFACEMCNLKNRVFSNENNKMLYQMLEEKLIEMSIDDSFPYQHVIIDEGQDLGREEIEEAHVIELLKANVLENKEKNGTFYLFYDKNQLIQANKVPSYIAEADCKLTLYNNCRNTINIAETSLRLLGSNKRVKIIDNAVYGDSTELYFSKDEKETIENLNVIIDNYLKEGYKNIQILTCSTLKNSIISKYFLNEEYNYNKKDIPVTTCRKFKGLEADAIILIDINMNVFNNNDEKIMYVGSSRARYKLSLIANLDESDCVDVLEKLNENPSKNPMKKLATVFNTKYKKLDI